MVYFEDDVVEVVGVIGDCFDVIVLFKLENVDEVVDVQCVLWVV